MTAPERSLAQRREALVKANLVRTTRKDLKAELAERAGYATAARAIADPRSLGLTPPDALDTMAVRDLLVALPGLGVRKVTRLMARLQISPSKTLAGLSTRQRANLVAELRVIAEDRAHRHAPNRSTAA